MTPRWNIPFHLINPLTKPLKPLPLRAQIALGQSIVHHHQRLPCQELYHCLSILEVELLQFHIEMAEPTLGSDKSDVRLASEAHRRHLLEAEGVW